MQSKKFFVEKICSLRGISPESDEAKELYNLKIVDLLIAIKRETPIDEPWEPDDTTGRFFTH